MSQLFTVNKNNIDGIWEDVKPFLEIGLKHSYGEVTIDQMRLFIVHGNMVLVISKDIQEQKIDGAVAIEFITFPNYRCANIVSMGGEGLNINNKTVTELKNICKQMGASKIQGWTRPAITRMLRKQGFNKLYDIVRIDI